MVRPVGRFLFGGEVVRGGIVDRPAWAGGAFVWLNVVGNGCSG